MEGSTRISLVVVICLMTTCVKDSSANHVKEIYELVFAMTGEPTDSENTLGMLETLRDMILADKEGRKLKGEIPKIQDLIEIGNVSQEKCDLLHMAHISDLYDHNFEYVTNIRPYIEFYRLKQFEVCQEVFASSLNRAFSDLPLEAQTAAKLFRDTYLEAKGRVTDKLDYLRMDEPALKLALVLYLGRQPFELITKEKVTGTKADETFKKIFSHTVTELCARITGGLESDIKLYGYLLGDEKVVEKIDNATLGWIIVYKLCVHENTHWKFMVDLRKLWLKKSANFWGDI